MAAGASGLLSFGLAGALDPTLRAGAVLLPQAVTDPAGQVHTTYEAWRERLVSRLGAGVHPVAGSLLSVMHPLTTTLIKSQSWTATGARAVDMESFAIAGVAAASGLKFAVARVVIDTAADSLPHSVSRGHGSARGSGLPAPGVGPDPQAGGPVRATEPCAALPGGHEIAAIPGTARPGPHMKRAFLTGGTGFVGAAVARALVAQGWELRALARSGSDRRNLSGLPIDVVTGDLRDPASYASALPGCEALFHVAADYRLWAPNPDDLYAINVEGTRGLLRAAQRAGVVKIVYTSSVATLRLVGDGTVSDESSIATLADMIGHYKRSKFLGEQLVQQWADAEPGNRWVVIVNPSTPVGPCDVKPTPTGQIVLDAAAGRTPAYVDTGLNIAHVDDIARGHLLALEHGRHGERYILGGEDLTLQQILTQVTQIRRGQATAPPPAAWPGAADCACVRGHCAPDGRQYANYGGGRAHGEEAHVFFQRQGGARTGLYLAQSRSRLPGRGALVS